MSGPGGRAVVGGALVADGLVGLDVPGGRRRVGVLGSLIMAVVGAAFVVAGLFAHSLHQPYQNGITATGVVSGSHTNRDVHGHITFSRIVEFTDTTGQQISVTDPDSSSTRPQTGSHVTVSYPGGDPLSARIIPRVDWLPWLIVAVGGIVALAGVITFVIRLLSLVAGASLLAGAWRRRH